MLKEFSKNLLIASLVFSFSYSVPSLTLKLKDARNLRSYEGNILVPDKVLPKDTIVTIPDDYVDAHFVGDKKNEKAIIKWLSEAHSFPLKKFQRSDGSLEIANDYFVPIEVKNSSDSGWVSLRSLALNGGLELVTLEEAAFINSDVAENAIENYKHENQYFMDATNGVLINDFQCHTNMDRSELDVLATLSTETNYILDRMLDNISLKSKDDFDNRKSHTHIIENFNRTCSPLDFDQFYSHAKNLAYKNGIPFDMFLGMMTQESAGRCDLHHNEKNQTTSIGLFQINTNSSAKKQCGNSKNALMDDNCLENPYTNVEEAIRILSAKYKAVNDEAPLAATQFNKLPSSKRDMWRKAISAYNGGEGHVFQAYHDIEKFNKQFDATLNPDDWDTRKIFMLRKAIERRGGRVLANTGDYKYRRSVHNSLSNLSYVESIVSSESRGTPLNHTNKWLEYINAN